MHHSVLKGYLDGSGGGISSRKEPEETEMGRASFYSATMSPLFGTILNCSQSNYENSCFLHSIIPTVSTVSSKVDIKDLS
jgi:hypothetical protein